MNGEPTSSLVGCLASIRKSDLPNPTKREEFWKRVNAKLQRLGLPEGEAWKAMKAIRRRVPRPANAAPAKLSTSRNGGVQSCPIARMPSVISSHEQSEKELLAALMRKLGMTYDGS